MESLKRVGDEDISPNLNKSKIIISVVLTAVLVLLANLYFQKATICPDQACFNEFLEKCHKTTFVGISNDGVYEYSIEGKSKDFCIVNVKLLQGQLTEKNSAALEGKSMSCEVPLGVVIQPESDMKNCHGELKEGLQEVIIENFHSYIVGNLAKINTAIES